MIIEINDYLIHDNGIESTSRSDSDYKNIKSKIYSIFSKYVENFKFNYEERQLLKNIVKNIHNYRDDMRFTFMIILRYFYYDSVENYNINLTKSEHEQNINHILNF